MVYSSSNPAYHCLYEQRWQFDMHFLRSANREHVLIVKPRPLVLVLRQASSALFHLYFLPPPTLPLSTPSLSWRTCQCLLQLWPPNLRLPSDLLMWCILEAKIGYYLMRRIVAMISKQRLRLFWNFPSLLGIFKSEGVSSTMIVAIQPLEISALQSCPLSECIVLAVVVNPTVEGFVYLIFRELVVRTINLNPTRGVGTIPIFNPTIGVRMMRLLAIRSIASTASTKMASGNAFDCGARPVGIVWTSTLCRWSARRTSLCWYNMRNGKGIATFRNATWRTEAILACG